MNKKTFLILTALLIGGGFLRFWNLDKFGFWNDELFHVIAAKSYLETGELTVPSHGRYYERSKITTMTTVAAFKLFGISEFSGRAPFVLINLLFILTGFFFVRSAYSDGVALIFSFVLLFSPFSIEIAREVRMYSPFQFLFFVSAWLFFKGFEADGEKRNISLPCLGWAAVFAIFSLLVHKLTVNLAVPVLIYCIVMMIWTFHREGVKQSLTGKYALLLGIFVIFTGSLRIFHPEILDKFIFIAREVPEWATYKMGNHVYYRYFLSNEYPFFFFTFFISTLLFVLRDGKRGLFLSSIFLVLFFMHSYVFGRKEERYIFYIFPFMLIPCSYLLAELYPHARRWLAGLVEHQGRAVKILLIIVLIPAINVAGYPWLGLSKTVPTVSRHPDWKSVRSFLSEYSEIPVLTTDPKAFYFYGPKFPEFYFQKEIEGDAEYESGLIQNEIEFMKTIEKESNLALVFSEDRYGNESYFTDSMRNVVESKFARIRHKGDERILVYRRKEEK